MQLDNMILTTQMQNDVFNEPLATIGIFDLHVENSDYPADMVHSFVSTS